MSAVNPTDSLQNLGNKIDNVAEEILQVGNDDNADADTSIEPDYMKQGYKKNKNEDLQENVVKDEDNVVMKENVLPVTVRLKAVSVGEKRDKPDDEDEKDEDEDEKDVVEKDEDAPPYKRQKMFQKIYDEYTAEKEKIANAETEVEGDTETEDESEKQQLPVIDEEYDSEQDEEDEPAMSESLDVDENISKINKANRKKLRHDQKNKMMNEILNDWLTSKEKDKDGNFTRYYSERLKDGLQKAPYSQVKNYYDGLKNAKNKTKKSYESGLKDFKMAGIEDNLINSYETMYLSALQEKPRDIKEIKREIKERKSLIYNKSQEYLKNKLDDKVNTIDSLTDRKEIEDLLHARQINPANNSSEYFNNKQLIDDYMNSIDKFNKDNKTKVSTAKELRSDLLNDFGIKIDSPIEDLNQGSKLLEQNKTNYENLKNNMINEKNKLRKDFIEIYNKINDLKLGLESRYPLTFQDVENKLKTEKLSPEEKYKQMQDVLNEINTYYNLQKNKKEQIENQKQKALQEQQKQKDEIERKNREQEERERIGKSKVNQNIKQPTVQPQPQPQPPIEPFRSEEKIDERTKKIQDESDKKHTEKTKKLKDKLIADMKNDFGIKEIEDYLHAYNPFMAKQPNNTTPLKTEQEQYQEHKLENLRRRMTKKLQDDFSRNFYETRKWEPDGTKQKVLDELDLLNKAYDEDYKYYKNFDLDKYRKNLKLDYDKIIDMNDSYQRNNNKTDDLINLEPLQNLLEKYNVTPNENNIISPQVYERDHNILLNNRNLISRKFNELNNSISAKRAKERKEEEEKQSMEVVTETDQGNNVPEDVEMEEKAPIPLPLPQQLQLQQIQPQRQTSAEITQKTLDNANKRQEEKTKKIKQELLEEMKGTFGEEEINKYLNDYNYWIADKPNVNTPIKEISQQYLDLKFENERRRLTQKIKDDFGVEYYNNNNRFKNNPSINDYKNEIRNLKNFYESKMNSPVKKDENDIEMTQPPLRTEPSPSIHLPYIPDPNLLKIPEKTLPTLERSTTVRPDTRDLRLDATTAIPQTDDLLNVPQPSLPGLDFDFTTMPDANIPVEQMERNLATINKMIADAEAEKKRQAQPQQQQPQQQQQQSQQTDQNQRLFDLNKHQKELNILLKEAKQKEKQKQQQIQQQQKQQQRQQIQQQKQQEPMQLVDPNESPIEEVINPHPQQQQQQQAQSVSPQNIAMDVVTETKEEIAAKKPLILGLKKIFKKIFTQLDDIENRDDKAAFENYLTKWYGNDSISKFSVDFPDFLKGIPIKRLQAMINDETITVNNVDSYIKNQKEIKGIKDEIKKYNLSNKKISGDDYEFSDLDSIQSRNPNDYKQMLKDLQYQEIDLKDQQKEQIEQINEYKDSIKENRKRIKDKRIKANLDNTLLKEADKRTTRTLSIEKGADLLYKLAQMYGSELDIIEKEEKEKVANDALETNLKGIKDVISDPTVIQKTVGDAVTGANRKNLRSLRRAANNLVRGVASERYLPSRNRASRSAKSFLAQAVKIFRQLGFHGDSNGYEWEQKAFKRDNEGQVRKRLKYEEISNNVQVAELYLNSLILDLIEGKTKPENEDLAKLYIALKVVGAKIDDIPEPKSNEDKRIFNKYKPEIYKDQFETLIKKIPERLKKQKNIVQQLEITFNKINKDSKDYQDYIRNKKQIFPKEKDSLDVGGGYDSNKEIKPIFIPSYDKYETIEKINRLKQNNPKGGVHKLDLNTGNYYPIKDNKQIKSDRVYVFGLPNNTKHNVDLKEKIEMIRNNTGHSAIRGARDKIHSRYTGLRRMNFGGVHVAGNLKYFSKPFLNAKEIYLNKNSKLPIDHRIYKKDLDLDLD